VHNTEKEVYTELYIFRSRSYMLPRTRIRGSVTNKNGFWIGWLDLLALLYNYNQLWQLTINNCPRLAPFLTGLRVTSTVTNYGRRMPAHSIYCLGMRLSYESLLNEFKIKVKVKVTLRLTVSQYIIWSSENYCYHSFRNLHIRASYMKTEVYE
jgi:hypothetical protein